VRVLIDYRPALRSRSGVGEYVHQLVAAFVAMTPRPGPLDVTIFSSSWRDRLEVAPELAGAHAIDRRVPVSILNAAWHRLEWPPAELVAGAAFDVAHSLHPLLMPTRRAAQVITIHDLDFLAHPERTRAEIRRDYAALAPAHARRADAVIVPSQFTAGEVQRLLGVPADRITVGSPGAPPWTPRAEAPRDGYLLFFGTLEPRKNVGALLDAYERLLIASGPSGGGRARVPELVLAGRETPEARPWLDRLARAPLAGRVRHIGYVDPSNRRSIYDGARVLVQPSFEEGFGIPVLEAMAAGVPVIAANRGALPEVLGEAGLLFGAEDAGELAAAIGRMVDEPGLAADCARRGAARAREYSWAETARKVCDAYARAVRLHGSRSCA
jgi:glycosyltransferase involved in cell wall biosynthesis